MALVFESAAIQLEPARTATHVLLIGCETYPGMATAGFGDGMPLGSPRRSVEAMADWFLGGADGMSPSLGRPTDEAFNNPDAPLGSVEILASPVTNYTTPANVTKAITRSTLPNVRDAYRRWLARLAVNPQNRGVFYFCGHGVGDGVDQYLVCDDFGEDQDGPWASVFHVANTCQVSIRKTSANLLFLIDACMEFSPDVLFQIAEPSPLINGARTGGGIMSTDWAVLRATTTNRLAYADPSGTARFTTALLQALRGHCGQQRPGPTMQFDVTLSQLRAATALFLARMQPPGQNTGQMIGTPQGEGAWNLALHVLTQRPSVMVELDVAPRGFRPVAQAFIERYNMPRDSKALTNGPAKFIVPQGEWTYGVGGGFPEQTEVERLLVQAVYSRCFPISTN